MPGQPLQHNHRAPYVPTSYAFPGPSRWWLCLEDNPASSNLDKLKLLRSNSNVVVGVMKWFTSAITYIPLYLAHFSSFFIMPLYTKEDMQNAIEAFKSGEYASISRYAYIFNIPTPTL